jgi:hypothetical protein
MGSRDFARSKGSARGVDGHYHWKQGERGRGNRRTGPRVVGRQGHEGKEKGKQGDWARESRRPGARGPEGQGREDYKHF